MLSRLLPVGHGTARWGYRAVIISCSVLIGVVAERGARQLAPLTVLLKLSMLFPDQAPSRFKVARRATSRQGLNRLAAGRDGHAASAATTIMELLAALAHHDKRTRGHAERVRVYTDLLAEQLRLPRADQDRLRWAALLHDIGKLAVDPAILNKPGKPSEREWNILRSHPEAGARAAAELLPWLGDWGSAIIEHHERFDGTGYPNGLSGSGISRAGRLLAVVDAYEVITAARSYKRPTSTAKAREELARCAGSHFDPVMVRAFLAISLPRLLWATGPLSFLVQLPFMGVLRDAGTKLASAGGPAVAAAAGAVVVATGTTGAAAPAATSAAAPRVVVAARGVSPVAPAPAPAGKKLAAAVTLPSVTPVPSTPLSTAPAPAPAPVPPPAVAPAAPPAHQPKVTVTQGPVAVSSATDAIVTFSVDDPTAAVNCSLDGAAPVSCPNGSWSGTGLSVGNHTLTIAATNAAGSGTASYAWTTTAPPPPPPAGSAADVTITAAPVASTTATDATIDFVVSDPATTTCSLDGAAFTSCSSPWTATGLPLGSHTLTIAATNAAGVRTTSYSWTITAPPVAAPTVFVISGPVSSTAATAATITFDVSDPAATLTCSLDAAPAVPCTSPWAATGLAVGSHTLTISATNAGGTGTASYSWTVTAPPPPPVGAPTVSVDSGPQASTTATDATIGFTVSDPAATVTCALDGGAASSCSSPWTATGLAVGSHTLTISATNAGGTGTASYSWTITAPPVAVPTVTVTGGPVASTVATDAGISFTVSDPAATVTCALDGGAASSCSSPWTATGLAVGSHTLTISATNTGGTGTASYSWTITTPLPVVVTLTATPPAKTGTKSATFSWTQSAGLSYACSLDGAAFTACTNTITYPKLKAATHTFRIHSTNADGVTSADTTFTWQVT